MDPICIHITGPRGSGKTTIAIEVAKFLMERNCFVSFQSGSRTSIEHLEEKSSLPPNPESMHDNIDVMIVDDVPCR
jgi:uridine kinase